MALECHIVIDTMDMHQLHHIHTEAHITAAIIRDTRGMDMEAMVAMAMHHIIDSGQNSSDADNCLI